MPVERIEPETPIQMVMGGIGEYGKQTDTELTLYA